MYYTYTMIIKKATEDDLKIFINEAGNSLNTFTYFKKRQLNIINNHVLTILGYIDDKPIAYGHLDKENNDIFLGICIVDKFKGKGYGNYIMKELCNFANTNNLTLKLSVYKENINAIKLYQKFGFIFLSETNESYFMVRRLFL